MITAFGKSFRGPSPLTRFVLLALLSAALMIFDHRGEQLQRLRAALMVVVYPIQAAASVPVSVYHAVVDAFTSNEELEQRSIRLEAERERLLARLERLDALEHENARLRAMLGAASRVADRVIAAELMEVSLEPFSRRLLIRRGSRDGVYIGQPAIDAYGIVGQVTQVSPFVSTVTLITDPSHAIPVLDDRSGLRTVVFGSGDQDALTVPYLSGVADIKEGDLLVSSGMGGVFPAGYPVATVTKIKNDPSESFLQVEARPEARLNHGKQILLIEPGPDKKGTKTP
jgi:rod shape-determining protein MreC